MRHIRLAAACLCLVGPAALDAQQPTRRQVDSLTAELRALRARFDSLVTDLQRRRSAADSAVRRDTAAVQAELEAVRAAALAASGSPDTTTARRAGGDRNLNQLNPEISVTGDMTKMMAMQQAGAAPDPIQKEIADKIQAITD